MYSDLRGGFPITLGSGADIFVVDWSIKYRRAIQQSGLYPIDFVDYWKDHYPKWAHQVGLVMYRLKHKGINLEGPFVSDDAIKANKMGPENKPLTREELTLMLAPDHFPTQANPWEGVPLVEPPPCCG